MKFWSLVSCFRSDSSLLLDVLCRPEWEFYYNYYRVFDDLVREQNRDVLDMELPDDLCLAVLAGCDWRYAISKDNLTRVSLSRINDHEVVLSAAEVFARFGGDCLEDIEEFGVYRISG